MRSSTSPEIEKFLDTPVKRYSSGMYVRLAFAVAAHLQPEILIVDEVLAVGDAAFQKKCLGKMKDAARSGRTVILVSHTMGVISSLCPHAIWMEEGRIRDLGESKSIVTKYLAEYAMVNSIYIDLTKLSGGGKTDRKVRIRGLEWRSGLPVRHGEDLTVRIHYDLFDATEDLNFGLGISSIEGSRIITFDTEFDTEIVDMGRVQSAGNGRWVDLCIRSLPVGPGLYSLDLGARSGIKCSLASHLGFAQLEVVAGETTPSLYISYPGEGVRMPVVALWGG